VKQNYVQNVDGEICYELIETGFRLCPTVDAGRLH